MLLERIKFEKFEKILRVLIKLSPKGLKANLILCDGY
jgi:hypothetical protein